MSLFSNIKSPENIKKIDLSNIISSPEYLNITLNGHSLEEYVKEFKGFDRYIPKIIYEDPENSNRLIIDHTYINYNGTNVISNDDIKDSEVHWVYSDKNRVLFLDFPDLNKLIITDQKNCTNCTFKDNTTIIFDKFAYEEVRLATFGDEKLHEYLNFLKQKLINCTYHGEQNGIGLYENTKNLIKRGSKWWKLINNIEYPGKFPYKFFNE